MNKSTPLSAVLDQLTQRARFLGLNDSSWAARAGMPKETLSRLRKRTSCDFATLVALAQAVQAQLAVGDTASAPATFAHFPSVVDRDYEDRLARLCVSRDLNPDRWRSFGPPFFMAGLAVMLASVSGFDRRSLLALAEQLHPGTSEPRVFQRWLESSPLRPSRFLPMLEAFSSHAA